MITSKIFRERSPHQYPSAGTLTSNSPARCDWHEVVHFHYMPLARNFDEVFEVVAHINNSKGQIKLQDHGQWDKRSRPQVAGNAGLGGSMVTQTRFMAPQPITHSHMKLHSIDEAPLHLITLPSREHRIT